MGHPLLQPGNPIIYWNTGNTENGFTQVLYEVYTSSNAFDYLELFVTIKHAQIGLTDVTLGIPALNLCQTNTHYKSHYKSQSWVLLYWEGFSLGAWGFSEKAKVVFIWFIFNKSCCLICSFTKPDSFSLRWRSTNKSKWSNLL